MAENITEVSGSGTQPAAGTNQPSIDELTARVRGLDRTVTEKSQKVAQLQELLADKEAKLKEFELQMGDFTGKLTKAEQQAQEWQKQIADAQASNATLNERLETQSLFMGKYSTLAKDYSEGLIRLDGLKGDERTAYLDKYAAAMATRGQQVVQSALAGALPSAAPSVNNGAPSLELLEQQWETANKNRNFAEAMRLANEIGNLRAQQK